ncbi:MAG: PDZ domain-containing protein, partial [Rhodospirillaceae bacterium]|nr:PDZ domain-containing protein [Rhodospirillaceae bacterium]
NGNGESAVPSGKKTTIESVGLVLSPITPSLRKRFELNEEIKGVLIVGVDDQGVAAEKGLRPGDVIVEVGQEEVSTPAAVEDKIKMAVNSDRKSVLMLVQRNGDLRFVPLRVVKSDG